MPNPAKESSGKTNISLNPISKPLPASTTAGPRSANQIKIIVLHSTEGNVGPGALDQLYDVLEIQGYSCHVGLNSDGSCSRMVDDLVIGQHCAAFNSQSLGIEQCGKAAQSSWPKAQTKIAARWIAYWCQLYDIPLTRSITHGICTHGDLGSAGGGHTDPGPAYPFNEVLKEAAGILGTVVVGDPGAPNSTTESSGGVTNNVSIEEVEATAKAAAFSTFLNLPGLFDEEESNLLKDRRSLMNDKPVLGFVEQLAQASLRRFHSMPNGNFYAFYPDYFGGLNQRTPYWEINDIEILDGKINLSDDSLATHVYVVGDTAGFFDGIDEIDKASTSGVVTLFRAMSAGFIGGMGQEADAQQSVKGKQKRAAQNKDQTLSFLKRYGARPYFEEAPMVRSTYYEMFLAYQRFCLLWSKQFLTEFELTYMPELFPGGLVAFPDHGLQLFVEEVNHTFDYEGGFTTTALFSAPTALANGPSGLHDGMIRSDALSPGR